MNSFKTIFYKALNTTSGFDSAVGFLFATVSIPAGLVLALIPYGGLAEAGGVILVLGFIQLNSAMIRSLLVARRTGEETRRILLLSTISGIGGLALMLLPQPPNWATMATEASGIGLAGVLIGVWAAFLTGKTQERIRALKYLTLFLVIGGVSLLVASSLYYYSSRYIYLESLPIFAGLFILEVLFSNADFRRYGDSSLKAKES